MTLAKRESVYLRPTLLVIDSMSRRNLLSTDGKWIEIDMPLTVNSARQLKHAGVQGCLSPVIRATCISNNCKNIHVHVHGSSRPYTNLIAGVIRGCALLAMR